MKAIDELELPAAKEIFKWLIASVHPKGSYDDAYVLKTSRNYLRARKWTPERAKEEITKVTASMPKRIF